MKRLLFVVFGILTLCDWSRGDEEVIPPNEGSKRDEWIIKHYDELLKRQSDLLRLPKEYPKEAIRRISPDLAAKIQVGTSFKIVLAVFGLPSEQETESGGSGPVRLPQSWWTYTLEDGSKLRLTFQFDKSLNDLVVTASTTPKGEKAGHKEAN